MRRYCWFPQIMAAAFCTARAVAHDFWIEPSNFRPAAGETVRIGLRVGEGFKGDPVPRNPEKIERFILVGPDGIQPVAGMDGKDPAGVTKVDRPGIYVIGYRSKRNSIELDAAKFEGYLKEEGLTKISALRAQRGESGKPGREVYSRAAKALLNVGGAESTGYDRVLGFTFEIVPNKDPSGLRPGQEDLPIVLFYDGKPAEGVEVFALNQSEPEAKLAEKSDREGRTSFHISKPGVWMIKAIHMGPAPPGVDADWESIWATLTFELRPPQ